MVCPKNEFYSNFLFKIEVNYRTSPYSSFAHINLPPRLICKGKNK